MARVHKKNLTNYLLLSLGITFFSHNNFCAEEHDFHIEHKSIADKEEKLKQESSTKATVKKSTSKKKVTIEYPKQVDYHKRLQIHEEKRTISDILIIGNNVINKNAILHRLPLKIGDKFSVNYTATMIKNIYKIGYFHQVKIFAEPIGEDKVNLHIMVQEKPRLKEIIFKGNKTLTSKDLKTELKTENIPTIVKEELTALIAKIKKYYQRKNFHDAEVTGKIIPEPDGFVSVEFEIKEGKKSNLTRIDFTGNKRLSTKRLRRIIFSKEDWILGFMDRAGTYNPEMIEGDKAMIEDAYKSNGFVHAKVTKIDTKKDEKAHSYQLEFHIHEGERYIISSVKAPGNETLSEDKLMLVIPVRAGQYYSVEKIRTALENLKNVWGEHGYIFADIEPIVDVDEEHKTVSIEFKSDLKDKVYLNRLTIKGNQKTRDKVIRRGILLEEGELLTNSKMEASKARVGLLNYFDQKDGANWKTTRIDENHADLDMILKEIKTGHMSFNIGYGGSPSNNKSPQTGLTVNGSAGDRNLWGTGIAAAISGEVAKRYRAFNGSLMNPYLFDKPIRGSVNAFIKKSEYDSVEIAETPPMETSVGGGFGVGYFSPRLYGILIEGQLTYERITFDNEIKGAKRFGSESADIASFILSKNFQAGGQLSCMWAISQDKRNGIVFTTNGHQWRWNAQVTFPGSQSTQDIIDGCGNVRKTQCTQFNYFRTEFDTSWYTPLIGEHDLVLGVHANLGFVHRFDGKDVPWRALYHVGGPTSVRGYTYGQVGPNWKDTSLGARKAFNVNVEFTAPLTSDLNTRAIIFYDGGAGWDTPYFDEIYNQLRNVDNNKGTHFATSFCKDLVNNQFFYRHSVGIGVRMRAPTPISVDFGIKLNPSKRFRKNLTEVHLSMDHQF